MVKAKSPKKGTLHVICCVEDKFPCGPLGGVVARAFPLFSKKTTGSGGDDGGETSDNNDEGGDEEEMMVHVSFIDEKGKVIKDQGQIDAAKAAAEGVRLACRLVGEFYLSLSEHHHDIIICTLCLIQSMCVLSSPYSMETNYLSRNNTFRYTPRRTNNHGLRSRMP